MKPTDPICLLLVRALWNDWNWLERRCSNRFALDCKWHLRYLAQEGTWEKCGSRNIVRTQLFSSMKVNFSFFNNTILDFYRSCSNCWYSEVFATVVVHFSNVTVQYSHSIWELKMEIQWIDPITLTSDISALRLHIRWLSQATQVLLVNLRAEPPFVFLSEAEKEGSTLIASSLWSRPSPNLWISQSGPLPSYKFSECTHPFVEKPMVITEPAVQCKRLY